MFNIIPRRTMGYAKPSRAAQSVSKCMSHALRTNRPLPISYCISRNVRHVLLHSTAFRSWSRSDVTKKDHPSANWLKLLRGLLAIQASATWNCRLRLDLVETTIAQSQTTIAAWPSTWVLSPRWLALKRALMCLLTHVHAEQMVAVQDIRRVRGAPPEALAQSLHEALHLPASRDEHLPMFL